MNVIDAIRTRRSVRAYSSKPISAGTIYRLAEAMRSAPSACNYQPWHFVWVQNAELRKGVAKAANDKLWLAEAPIIVVACGMPEKAYPKMGGYSNSVDIDLAIAMDHLILAATTEGLGTCWIGAFNEATVKQLLGIPAGVKIVAMTPLGYPASPDLLRPIREDERLPLSKIISTDRYAGPPLGVSYPDD
ncbi:MAG TPA: nitroreductase family protein [Phycisphaerae bacterium]|nr:nitroreductase family protein [Phycisphaerae bacterium]HRY68083.1 nitroreductase family protein [Phycisphaerae bacterium]HSA29051.1 nitroreductase family protein [Phycisphaerae bacterium]